MNKMGEGFEVLNVVFVLKIIVVIFIEMLQFYMMFLRITKKVRICYVYIGSVVSFRRYCLKLEFRFLGQIVFFCFYYVRLMWVFFRFRLYWARVQFRQFQSIVFLGWSCFEINFFGVGAWLGQFGLIGFFRGFQLGFV